jgi:2-polyprenyl-3-methyl-5-hydroxy-6-metoxy-1,4-benzoquinol methylase
MTHKNPLKIIAVQEDPYFQKKNSSSKTLREEIQTRFDRMWQQNPLQFDPLIDCAERERLQRTSLLIKKHVSLEGKKIVDLGCGAGALSQILNEAGGIIDAVDVSPIALKRIQEKKLAIKTIQDCLPSTLLKDEVYDLVICTDVIAYLTKRDYRLFFSELARLVKNEGYVVCSTPIDFNSEDALQQFISLAKTELQFLDWIVSFHRIYIALRNIFEAPNDIYRASQDKEFRDSKLAEKNSLRKWWFKINSTPCLALFWKMIAFSFNPIARFVKKNRMIMLILEKISRIIYGDTAISHFIFIAKRRPLIEPSHSSHTFIERKQKKTVWD